MSEKKRRISRKTRFDINDYADKRFGKLIATNKTIHLDNENRWKIICKCDCGGEIYVMPYQLKNGSVKSCGCEKIKPHHVTHNRSKCEMFGTWKQMISRCSNPSNKKYSDYGGRGISVCEEWLNFDKFNDWVNSVGGRPNGYTLDRIDTNGNYCPDNCRFVPWSIQASNKRTSHLIEYKGEVKALSVWAKELCIPYYIIEHRINRGWNVERALTTPVAKKST